MDIALRNATYRLFVESGRAPDAAGAGAALGLSADAVISGWRRLHSAHALVLDETGSAPRMLNPFSAVPTPHRVDAAGHRWYANCAWDAFGICSALRASGRIQTPCADCGEALALMVPAAPAEPSSLIFHSLVPARRWWDDIGYT